MSAIQKRQILCGAHPLTLLLPDGAPEGIIYLPMHENAEGIRDFLPEPRAALVFIGGFDWNRDLSPWPAKAVFGDRDFGGQAAAFLKTLTEEILPAAEETAQFTPRWRGIAGYSLAGLFAVYAAYRCNAFTRVASVSGSTWYDGWLDYAARTPLAAPVDRAYFSVGTKEKKTRNARMATVEDSARAMRNLFAERGAESTFVLNPGNHFVDAEKRLADALAFLMK